MIVPTAAPEFSGSSLLVCAERASSADAKYLCANDLDPADEMDTCRCFNFDADGVLVDPTDPSQVPAVMDGLCSSSALPNADWEFTYELHDGEGCTDPMEDFVCYDLQNLASGTTPSTEPLAPGLNLNDVVCVGPPALRAICGDPTVNPLTMRSDFLVMVEGDVALNNNETEGTLAAGGNLTLGRGIFTNYNLNFQGTTMASFVAPGDTNATALLVGGIVNLNVPPSAAGSIMTLQRSGFIKIGDGTGVDVLNQGGTTRVVDDGQGFDSAPRIEFTNPGVVQSPASAFSTTWTELLNFDDLFQTYRNRSDQLASPATCPQTVSLINAQTSMPLDLSAQVPLNIPTNITLTAGMTNVLDIGLADNLNRIQSISFQNPPGAPSATTPLLINVHTPGGVFTWSRIPSMNISDPQSQFIVWNFPEATQITQLPGCTFNPVFGTIFAPRATLTDQCEGNNVGNIVVSEFVHGTPNTPDGSPGFGGEVHNEPFTASISCPCE